MLLRFPVNTMMTPPSVWRCHHRVCRKQVCNIDMFGILFYMSSVTVLKCVWWSPSCSHTITSTAWRLSQSQTLIPVFKSSHTPLHILWPLILILDDCIHHPVYFKFFPYYIHVPTHRTLFVVDFCFQSHNSKKLYEKFRFRTPSLSSSSTWTY